MNATLSLILTVCLVASVPVLTQEQSKRSNATELREFAPGPGPIARAISREAARLAARDLNRPSGTSIRPGGKSDDWSRVRDFEGEEIVLTLNDSSPGARQVVRRTVDDYGFTVLNLTDPAIPHEVKSELASAAWWHADAFRQAENGGVVRMNKHVQLAQGGVLFDGRRVADLEHIVEHVARRDVAEISYVHSGARRGLLPGALLGVLAGALIYMDACGASGGRETSECGNLTGLWLFMGPGMGLGLGAAAGSAVRIQTVIYRAP